MHKISMVQHIPKSTYTPNFEAPRARKHMPKHKAVLPTTKNKETSPPVKITDFCVSKETESIRDPSMSLTKVNMIILIIPMPPSAIPITDIINDANVGGKRKQHRYTNGTCMICFLYVSAHEILKSISLSIFQLTVIFHMKFSF